MRRRTFLAAAGTTLAGLVGLARSPRAVNPHKPKPTTTVGPTTTLPATTTTGTTMPTTTVTMGENRAQNRYGIAWGSGTPSAGDWDAMQAAGVQWVRLDVDWWGVEDPQGTFNWTRWDGIMTAANARNIKVLGMVGYNPQWNWPAGATSDKYPPTTNTAWANFCTILANRYKNQNGHYWEIWNEPNGPTFWKPAPDPARYTSMMAAAYTALKTADPAARVLCSATAAANTTGGLYSPPDFLAAVYSNSGAGSFDAVAAHPYCWSSGGTHAGDAQSWSSWYRMYGAVAEPGVNNNGNLRAVMTANGDTAKPIWATEYGVPTKPPSAIGTASDAAAETFQADDLATALTLWKGYSWTTSSWGNAPLFWYQWRDQNTTDTTNTELHYGLEHTDGSDKPAMATFVTEAAKS